MTPFKDELTALINAHSLENGSDTPDFILAQYLTACLEAFDNAVNQRRAWNSPAWLAGRELPKDEASS